MMVDEQHVPREPLEWERLRYQWYTGYDRKDEYDKNPQWTEDVHTEENEVGDDYTKPTLRFYDRYDPDHIWIRSATVYSLMEMR